MRPPPPAASDLPALAAAVLDDVGALVQLQLTSAASRLLRSAGPVLVPLALGGLWWAVAYLLAVVGAVRGLTPALGPAGAVFAVSLAHLLAGGAAFLVALRRRPAAPPAH
jgi:hypothetical protein